MFEMFEKYENIIIFKIMLIYRKLIKVQTILMLVKQSVSHVFSMEIAILGARSYPK